MTWWDELLRARYLSDWKDAVRMVQTSGLPAYARVGNTITATATGAAPAIDGVTPALGDSMLITNGTSGTDNGIYTWTSLGGALGYWSLERRWDMASSSDVHTGMRVGVAEGTVWSGYVFRLSTTGPIVLNATSLSIGPEAKMPNFGLSPQVIANLGAGWVATADPIVNSLTSNGAIAAVVGNLSYLTLDGATTYTIPEQAAQTTDATPQSLVIVPALGGNFIEHLDVTVWVSGINAGGSRECVGMTLARRFRRADDDSIVARTTGTPPLGEDFDDIGIGAVGLAVGPGLATTVVLNYIGKAGTTIDWVFKSSVDVQRVAA